MRALHLRAWDEERAYMTYSSDDCWSFDEFGGSWLVAKRIGYYNSVTHESHEVKGMEVMTGTGVYDKNGKEMYEGDIVLFQTALVIIKWEEGGFYVGDFLPGDIGECRARCEIIGNRFETPELLNDSAYRA